MSAATVPERHVALYSILVDGAEVDRAAGAARSTRCGSSATCGCPTCARSTASFPKGTDGRGQPIDEHPFDIGRQLEIRLGAREELTTTTLFKGEIVSLDADFGSGGVDLLVRGFDHSHALLRSRNARTFQNQTSSDIVERILRDAGFESETDPSGEPHSFVQQDNETDWDFIWRLAERVGFEFVVEDGIARFRRQQADGSPVALEWPTTLRSFRPRVTAVQQVDEVTLVAQDRADQASDRRDRLQPATDRADRRRSRTASERRSREPHPYRNRAGQKPGGGTGSGAGPSGQARERLRGRTRESCDGNPSVRRRRHARAQRARSRSSAGRTESQLVTHVLRGGSTYETRFANIGHTDAPRHGRLVGQSSGVAPVSAHSSCSAW